MLDFPRIREILAGLTSFSASRSLADAIHPSSKAEVVQSWLSQSAEARQLLAKEPGFSTGRPVDIRPAVAMAIRGKLLDAETLLDIRSTLASGGHLRQQIKTHSDELQSLWEIARDITIIPGLEAVIDRCIEPGGEILDTASEHLANIRYELKEVRRQMMNRLENLLKSDWIQVMLQDSYVTERGGRYVIPIKTEFQGEFKGIIHDISNTGATVFVEPLQTVDLGNSLRQLVLEEEIEIQRILAELSQEVAENGEDISRNVALIAELDLALAKAIYAIRFNATEPCIITDEESARRLKIIDARHPLLQHNKAVPISIEIGYSFFGLVITGPNTGGKTVSLKTMGLLVLMAQSGIPIPAAPESEIAVFDDVFADVGDEQSIEETLSSFSWHMGNIVRIIRNSTRRSLVLLDELGTSTDPSEGAALARAILLHFLQMDTLVAATTHFNELKVFAHATPGLENASMEFDPVTLMPSYKITIGIPGGSNALAIASQLGIPPEIIASAREMMPQHTSEMEKMLAELTSERDAIRAQREKLSRDIQAAEEQKGKAKDELIQVESSRRQLILEERESISREAAELHRQIRQAAADLRKERSRKSLESATVVLDAVREGISSGIWHQEPGCGNQSEESSPDIPELMIGDTVRLTDTNITGKVGALLEKSGQVEIHSGRTRIKVDITDIEKLDPKVTEPVARKFTLQRARSDTRHALELDLRGKRADEVEPELDFYLNDVSIAGFPEVRIIHGYGTGIVRQIVRDMLASHPLIKSFRSGKQEEGGDGVTIATL